MTAMLDGLRREKLAEIMAEMDALRSEYHAATEAKIEEKNNELQQVFANSDNPEVLDFMREYLGLSEILPPGLEKHGFDNIVVNFLQAMNCCQNLPQDIKTKYEDVISLLNSGL